jgi:hypothetical protein
MYSLYNEVIMVLNWLYAICANCTAFGSPPPPPSTPGPSGCKTCPRATHPISFCKALLYRKCVYSQAPDRSDFFGPYSRSRSFWKIGSDSAFRSTCVFWIADPIRSDLPIRLTFKGHFFSSLHIKLVWQKKRVTFKGNTSIGSKIWIGSDRN